MSATTRNPVSMILAAVLFAGAAFEAPAFAATLAGSEHAAQAAIVGDTENRAVPPTVVSSPNLARSEALAQRVIVDTSTPAAHQGSTIGEASLTHNEIAAQRSIVDATALDALARNAGTATTSAASMRSPQTR